MPSHVPLATTADTDDADDEGEVDVDEDHVERLARLRARDPPRPGADSGDAVPIDPDAADVRLHRTLTDEELERQIGVLRAECGALEAALAEVQVLSDRWVFRSELTEKQLLLDRLEDERVWRETKAVYAAQQDRIVAQHATVHFDLEIGDDDEGAAVRIGDSELLLDASPQSLQAWGQFCRGTIDTWKGIAAVAVGFALTAAAAAATAAALLS